jgi:protein-S-isoprenylcysteine O-methyltransferase Ste14
MKYSPSLFKAFVIFPLNVMGVIPAFLIWCSRPGGMLHRFPYSFGEVRFLAGALLVFVGVGLCWKTVSLFTEQGEGTPAPFDPPKKLVILGPYVWVRNPMMVGVWLVLLGEALIFGSLPLGIWLLIFIGLCLILIPVWEEPDLERRFGEPYREYMRQVPRWIPSSLCSLIKNNDNDH